MSNTIETLTVGHPADFASAGIAQIEGATKRRTKTTADAIQQTYSVSIDEDTAAIADILNSADDASELIATSTSAGVDEIDDYSEVLPEFDEDDASLQDVFETLDTTKSCSLASREKDASSVSTKNNRERCYFPEIHNRAGDDGTVYMAKTIGATDKVRIAWDLHDDNVVVVVDDYDVWENLLGWEKLKSLPHGKHKIREELGDQLSDDVLDEVASSDDGDSDSSSTSSTSNGRSTRTKPTDETLNVATSSRNRDRTKMKAENILEGFQDDGKIAYNVDTLILFPTTTDLNMTEHWWVAGKKWNGNYAAIANCNKGTFEYLNQADEVWHIEEYIEQASDYEFDTEVGPATMDTLDLSKTVFHVVDEDMKRKLKSADVVGRMLDMLPSYCDNNMYRSPDFPHADDIVYSLITPEDVFWMRPELMEQTDPSDDDAIVLYTAHVRNLPQSNNLSGDYKFYARARLPDWDFDEYEELKTLDSASYSLDLDDGGYEVIETLGLLHDAGKKPFSQTPKARWSQ